VARVILTQPQPRVQSIAAALRGHGHEAVEFSFMRIEFQPDAELAGRLEGFDWVIATSPAAIAALADSLPHGWPTTQAAPGLGLIGPGSLASLRQTRLDTQRLRVMTAQFPPFDAAALMKQVPFDQPNGLRVLVVRGDTGRDDWIDDLRRAGANVEVCALYRRQAVEPSAEARHQVLGWLRQPPQIYCVVTQSETAERLRVLPETAHLGLGARPDVMLTIHPRIAQTLEQAGFTQVRLVAPGQAALLAALE
jgi:uroporphyrinogen-III synthase